MSRYSIGVDLGGTNLRAAVVDESGNILDKLSSSTPLGFDPEPIVDEIADSIIQLRARHGAQNLAGVGTGVPGFIIMATGVIANWGNRPGFKGYPMRAELEKRVGARVILENDANCAALGEHWIGAAKGVQDFLLLTLGTGVGGGIVIDGKVLRGFLGMAAELGHVTVVPNGNPCGCGNRGCVEKYASATAISTMAHGCGLGQGLTAHQVYELACQGNERAKQVFTVMGESLGVALANFINIFNPPLCLLAGGVLGAWDCFAPPMMAEVARRSFTWRATDNSSLGLPPTRIEKATLGNQAGLIGAAYLPFIG